MNIKAMQKKQYEDLCTLKAEIDEKVAPIAKKREALWEKIHPLKAEIDALAAKEKAIKGEDYALLCQEIGQLAIKLGGRALSDSARRAE